MVFRCLYHLINEGIPLHWMLPRSPPSSINPDFFSNLISCHLSSLTSTLSSSSYSKHFFATSGLHYMPLPTVLPLPTISTFLHLCDSLFKFISSITWESHRIDMHLFYGQTDLGCNSSSTTYCCKNPAAPLVCKFFCWGSDCSDYESPGAPQSAVPGYGEDAVRCPYGVQMELDWGFLNAPKDF